MRSTLAVLAFLSVTVPVIAQSTPTPPVIVTQGEATVKRAPDRAWMSVATETRDVKPAEARRKNAEAMTAVQNALKGAGVGADAIRTTGYSLTPEFDWNDGRSTLRGYVVRNQIEVRVDNLDTLPDVLDAAIGPKNAALSMSGPRFDLKDEPSAENEALRVAVQAAMSRARAIASGAGRTLGPILRIDDQNPGSPAPRPIQMMARAVAGPTEASTPITPGEIEIHVQVTVTVEMR